MRPLVPCLAGLLAVLSACQDLQTPQALFVQNNLFVSTRTQCQIRAGTTEFRARGVMDLAMTNTYWLFPQVENLLDPSETYTGLGAEQLRLANNNLTIIGATVDYDYETDPELSAVAGELGETFEAYQGIFVHGSGGVQPGDKSPIAIPVFPWDLGNALKDSAAFATPASGVEVVVRVVVHALMADNTIVRSNEFWYPITICNGCLIYALPQLEHPGVIIDEIAIPCFPGQDDGVDVRLCYKYAYTAEDRDRCIWELLLNGTCCPESDIYAEFRQDGCHDCSPATTQDYIPVEE